MHGTRDSSEHPEKASFLRKTVSASRKTHTVRAPLSSVHRDSGVRTVRIIMIDDRARRLSTIRTSSSGGSAAAPSIHLRQNSGPRRVQGSNLCIPASQVYPFDTNQPPQYKIAPEPDPPPTRSQETSTGNDLEPPTRSGPEKTVIVKNMNVGKAGRAVDEELGRLGAEVTSLKDAVEEKLPKLVLDALKLHKVGSYVRGMFVRSEK